MALEKTNGVILKSIKYSETDKIITCYTENFGKIQCIAKRARQKKNTFGASLDLLTYANLIIVKNGVKNIYLLRETNIVRSHYRLQENLPRLFAALYMAELIQELTGFEDKKPEVLLLFLKQLEMLQQGEEIEKVTHIFEIRLLTLLGYCPQLDKCLFCSTAPLAPKVGFSHSMGGIICPTCYKKKRPPSSFISMGSVNFLRQAVKLHLSKTPRLQLTASSKKELQSLLYSFIVYHLEKKIHSYRFLYPQAKETR